MTDILLALLVLALLAGMALGMLYDVDCLLEELADEDHLDELWADDEGPREVAA